MPRAKVTAIAMTNSAVSAPDTRKKGHQRRDAVQLGASRRVVNAPSSIRSWMTGYGSHSAGASRSMLAPLSVALASARRIDEGRIRISRAAEISNAGNRPELGEHAERPLVVREMRHLARWIGQ